MTYKEDLHNIPILIPAKGESKRCPNKNLYLLPYLSNYLLQENLTATVLSNDSTIRELAEKLGLNSWEEHRTEKDDDLSACRKYINNIECDFYFELPLTQPFKHSGLLYEMLNAMTGDVDFIVTSHMVSDRSIFYINDNKFIINSKERKGCLCLNYEMIDGAAYLIRKSFINRVHNNEDFWNGNFKTVLNKAPFLDIDTLEDMELFKFICNYNKI